MAVPKNKAELILEITHNYAKLKEDLETVPMELCKAKELQGHAKGTEMSVSDLVFHRACYLWFVLRALGSHF